MCVFGVERFGTLLQQPDVAPVVGLSPAADAAARTCHDFDGMVRRRAVHDLSDELPGIGEPVGDADSYRRSVEVHRRRTDTLHAAEFGEVYPVERLFRLHFVRRAHGSLYYAARGAEDDAGTGRFAQRPVEIVLFEQGEIHVGEAYHVGKFARRYRDVHVRVAVTAELRPRRFGLLGHAGHDGDHDEVFAVDAQLLREVVLGDGAEHLLRRFGRREVVGQLREVLLHEAHPAGTAGGHERQLYALVAPDGSVQASEQLGTLLHDGEVGGEVGVEHVIETEPAQRGNHLARHAPAGEAEILSEPDAHGGSGLYHYRLGGVGDGTEHVGDVGVLRECARGAYRHALSAVDAVGRLYGVVEGGAHHCRETAVDGREDAYRLDFVAGGLAAAAHDALVHVAHDGYGHVLLVFGGFAPVFYLPYAQVLRRALQFAVAVLGAGEAVVGVVGEDELLVRMLQTSSILKLKMVFSMVHLKQA